MFLKFMIITILATVAKKSFAQTDCKSINQNSLVLTTLNGKIKGACYNYTINYQSKPKSTDNPIVTWLSVPYAEPPVGVNRFKNPIPIRNWANTRDGTKASNNCMQYEKMDQTRTSEDCLYLNIDTPYYSYVKSVIQNDRSKLAPIFVWIHGGGWIFGSGNEYDGSTLAAMKNMVSITINYRLGPFGFTHIKDTEAKGNQAMLDQSLALKWIYENAASFGGDKNRITICGESAGSWSVGYHLLFKQSWPYFNNAILQSGAPARLDFDTLLLTSNEATSESHRIGAILGCHEKSNQGLLDCLQKVDKKRINKVFNNEITYAAFVLDNTLFSKHPKQLLQNGDFKKCNVMVGTTTFEELSLAPFEIEQYIASLYAGNFNNLKKALKLRLLADDKQIDKIIDWYIPDNEINNKGVNYYVYFIAMITDYQYRCPSNEFAEYLSKYNNDIFVYSYGHRSSTSKEDPLFDGAAHSEEIDYMFGVPLMANQKFTASERGFSEKMVDLWGNFVARSIPTLNDDWKKFNSLNSTTKRNAYFLRDKSIGNINVSLADETCKFWNDLNIINYYLRH